MELNTLADPGFVDAHCRSGGRPVAAARIFAMTAGAAGVEIANRLRPVSGGLMRRAAHLGLKPKQVAVAHANHNHRGMVRYFTFVLPD